MNNYQTLPIVAFSSTWWDGVWMNRQQLLTRLALRGHPVVYSNGTVHYSELGQVPLLPGHERHDNLVIMRSGFWLPRTSLISPLARLSMRLHLRHIRATLKPSSARPLIGMCFDPLLIDFIDMLAPALRVFHIYDAYNRMESGSDYFANLRERIRGFDLVTASSAQMYADVLGHAPDPRHVVPNGVDFALMSAAKDLPCAVADRIRQLPAPRIGYTGSVNSKFHFNLVDALARARPDISIVIVGPVREAPLRKSPDGMAGYAALRRLPNVYFIDEIGREEVPAVLNAMDINCLFVRVDRDDWVASTYPLKLHEYLAIGKPVISTPITVVREQFADVIDVCDSLDEWLLAIDRNLVAEHNPDKVQARRAIAEHNDWSRSVAQLEALLEEAARDKLAGGG